MEYEKCECNWYMGGLVKDHHYGLPITMVDFHTQQGLVVSSDAKAVKLWNMRNVSVMVHGWVSQGPSLWVTYHYGRLPYSAGTSSLIRCKGCQAMEYEKCECNYMGTWVGYTQQGLVVSSDAKAVKLWNMRNVSVIGTWVG